MATATEQEDTGVIDAEFTIIETPKATQASLYYVTDKAIAELKTELTGLTEYQAVSKGIAKVRSLRVSIEAKRKQLKAESLAWGRRVDSEAKRITEQLEAIEEPLKLLKQQVDEAKEKAKQAAEAARVAENLRRCECFKELEYPINPFLVESMTTEEYNAELALASIAFNEVLQKRAQAAADAEAARLKAIADEAAKVEALRIEREQLEAERAKLEAERAEHNARIESERAEQAEKARLAEEANAALLAKMQADIDEANRIDREEAARIQAERDEANRKQAEAMQAEREALKVERERIAKQDFDRQAKMQAEADERQRIEDAAKAEALRVEQEAAEALRLEALKPDIQKIRAFGDVLRLLNYPVCENAEAIQFVKTIKQDIDMQAVFCDDYCEEFKS